MTLLEKSCDQCLLTSKHCAKCRIDKLRKVLGQFESGNSEIMLISTDELKVLLSLAGETGSGREIEVVAKWRRIVDEVTGKEITA